MAVAGLDGLEEGAVARDAGVALLGVDESAALGAGEVAVALDDLGVLGGYYLLRLDAEDGELAEDVELGAGIAGGEGDLAVEGFAGLGVAAGRDLADAAVLEADGRHRDVVGVVVRDVIHIPAGAVGEDRLRIAEVPADEVEVVYRLLDYLTAGDVLVAPPVDAGDPADADTVDVAERVGEGGVKKKLTRLDKISAVFQNKLISRLVYRREILR